MTKDEEIKALRQLIKALVAVLLLARKYIAKMEADGAETVFSPRAMLVRIDKMLGEVEALTNPDRMVQ